MKLFGSLKELVSAVFRKDTYEITLRPNQSVTYSGARDVQLPAKDGNAVLVSSGDIVNSDINASAAIAYSKLALSNSIVNADVSSSAAIAYSKLNLASSIVNADISNSAAIAYSKLSLSNSISNGDIASNAAIDRSKLAAGTASHVLINDGSGNFSSEAQLAKSRGGAGADMSSVTFPSSGTLVTRDATETLLNKTTVSSTGAATGALTLPSGTAAEQPGQPLQPAASNGMIRYNIDTNSFEGYASGAWSAIGGGGTTDKVNQASHGFSMGDVLYMNGSVYTKADADAANTSEVVGVVSRVVGANDFEITLSGEVSGLTSANFTEAALPSAGEALFLSATPGKMTVTEPSVIGQVSVPIGVASGSGTMYVAIKRGVVVGGSNARTELPLSNNASTTIYTTPTGLEAGEIKGWVYLDATTDYRFFLSAQFARNGANSDWNLSYQTTGDTPPAGFNVTMSSAANGVISIVLPNLAGFSSGKINYALNAPAVGATFPLSISGNTVVGGTPTLDTINANTSGNGVQIQGRTNGVAIPSGYVGEMFGTNSDGTGGYYVSTNSTTVPGLSATSLVSLTLNKGIYLCTFYAATFGSTHVLFAGVNIGGTAALASRGYNAVFNSYDAVFSITLPVVITADSTPVVVSARYIGTVPTTAVNRIAAVRIA